MPPRKPTVKSLRNKADKLWAKAVLARAGGKCELCFDPAKDPHHIYRKERNAHLRYDYRNGMALCKRCHLQTRYDPMRIDMHIVAIRGFEEMEQLDALPHRDKPWSVKSLQHVIVGLEHGLKMEEA